jgi:hypothetical protein
MGCHSDNMTGSGEETPAGCAGSPADAFAQKPFGAAKELLLGFSAMAKFSDFFQDSPQIRFVLCREF